MTRHNRDDRQENTETGTPRRRFLGLGAAAAVGATGVAATAAAGSDDPPLDHADIIRAATYSAALEQPTFIPGAESRFVDLTEATGMTSNGQTNVRSGGDGGAMVNSAYNAAANGWIHFPLGVPAGSVVLAIDAYGYRTGGVSATWAVSVLDHFTDAPVASDVFSPTSTNGDYRRSMMSGSLPIVLQSGQQAVGLFIGGAKTNAAYGIHYQYLPPKPAFCALGGPVRIYDSRPGKNPTGVRKGRLDAASEVERIIQAVPFGSDIPSFAQTLLVNLTVVETGAGSGYVALYNDEYQYRGNSSINWSGPGQILANTTAVDVSSTGTFAMRVAGSCHVVVDIVGYWTYSGVNFAVG